MKSLTLFFVLIMNYSFSQWVFDNIPAPKIQEDGKCIVYYELNQDYYQYKSGTKIIDWHKSSRKIESQEPIKQNKLYLIEKYRKNDGVKEGKYELKIAKVTYLSSGSLTLTPELYAEIGEFSNDKLNGKVINCNYWNGIESYIQFNYKNGVISDSIIKFPKEEVELYKDRNNNTHKLTLQPYVKFQDGKVMESLFLDEKKLPCLYLGKHGNLFSYLRYTNYPISSNYFSYANDGKKSEIKSDISIEHYSVKDESENSNLYQGNYRRFDINSDVLFDTSFFAEYIFFNEGKRTGISNIWGSGKNGHKDSPWSIYNYENDLLEGKSMSFYGDDKVHVSANFIQGKLFGEAVVYSYGNRKDERKLKQKISYQNQIPITNLWQILETYPSEAYVGAHTNLIELYVKDLDFIRKKGGIIDEFSGYEEYMKVNYMFNSSIGKSVPSEDINIYNNGKVMVKYEIEPNQNGNIKNAIWYDNNSNEVFNNDNFIDQIAQTKQKELKIKQQEEEAQHNSIVKCDWCKKDHKYGEGEHFYDNYCNCIGRNDGSNKFIRTGKTSFCSKDCLTKFHKDICIRSGYKYE